MIGSIQTAIELGLIASITVMALFLSYSMLNVCDLSTDGAYTLGAVIGAVVAVSGHPYLSIIAAIGAGMLSGFITAILQTKMGVDSLLSGIVVNTGLYSINIAIMNDSSIVTMNKTVTVFTRTKEILSATILSDTYKLIVALAFVLVVYLFLILFLKTRLGLAIRATGDNKDMVRSSSINPDFTTIIGLVIANGMTALSGCLLAQSQKSANINIGSGVLTVALASLLIGRVFFRNKKVSIKALGAIAGAIIFRLVYGFALRLNMPATMLKLVSSVIVVIAVAGPYAYSKYPKLKRKIDILLKRRKKKC